MENYEISKNIKLLNKREYKFYKNKVNFNFQFGKIKKMYLF